MSVAEDIQEKPGETPLKKKRRRRWLRILLATVLPLVALAAALPSIVSSSWVTGWIVSVVGDKVQGDIRVDDLSVGWLSPVTVTGIHIVDPDGRRVLDVDSVRTTRGLLGFLWSGQDFGEVTVGAPDIVLYVDADGRISLADALRSVHPSPEKQEEGALPHPQGVVKVRNGTVRVVRPDGRSVEYSDLNTSVTLDSLDAMVVDLAATPAGGKEIKIKVDVGNLVKEGRIALAGAKGKLTFSAPDFDLAPLAAFMGRADLKGVIDGRIDVTFDGLRIDGEVTADVRGLSAPGLSERKIKALDVALVAQARTVDDRVAGTVKVTGPGIVMNAGFSAPVDVAAYRVDPKTLMSAALKGTSAELPDLRIDAEGEVDLPGLSRAVPGLLSLRENVAITSGRFRIKDLSARGGKSPVLSGGILVEELAADVDGENARFSPLSITLDLALAEKLGLTFGRSRIETAFAKISLGGRLAALDAPFSFDTKALRDEIGRIVDLGGIPFDGAVAGKALVRRRDDEHYAVRLNVDGKQWRIRAGDKALTLHQAEAAFGGDLVFAENRPRRVEDFTATLGLDDNRTLSMKFTGSADLADNAAKVAFSVAFDASPLAAYAKTLGRPLPRDVAGAAELEGNLDWSGGERLARTTGSAKLHGLRADGRALLKGKPLTLEWTDVRASLDGSSVDLASFRLVNDVVTVILTDAHLGGTDGSLKTGFSVGAALEPLLDDVRFLLRNDNIPNVRGSIEIAGSTDVNKKTANLAADGKLTAMAIALEKGTWEEPEVTFNLKDIKVDRGKHGVGIGNVNLTAGDTFSLTGLNGTVADFDTTGVLDLRGSYGGDWDRWMQLARTFAPGLRDVAAFTGKTGGEFTIKGAANDPKISPVFADLAGGAPFGWQSGKIYDVDIGGARMRPRIEGGKVTIPLTQVAAAGGTFRIAGVVDFTPGEPEYRLEDEVALMQDMPVTKTMARELLSRFNPVFAQQASIEGKVTLKAAGLALPLSEAIRKRGRGRGQLDLTGLRIQPEGLLAAIMKLAKRASDRPEPIQMTAVDFELKDGRVKFENFAMIFSDDFDLRFRGSVGFDDTVDVWVSLPVRTGVLEKLGVTGPLPEYVKVLDDARIEVPISGSRTVPKLDLSKVDIKPLVAVAVQRLMLKTAKDRLDILDRLPLPTGGLPIPSPKDVPVEKPEKKSSGPGVRDILRDALGDLLGPLDELEKGK